MPSIGHFTKKENGSFEGQIRMLSFKAPVQIVPVSEKAKETHPDYRVFSGSVEIGAAWERIGRESGEPYVSVSLASPELGPRTLYATLVPDRSQDDPGVHALIWTPQD